jgi:tetratricopeptide (TPR) repeat protein
MMQSTLINSFVGRHEEREAWCRILADSDLGQAIVVVGKYGMGKTWLLDQMINDACQIPALQCAALRYSVAPGESPAMVMKMMLEDAFQAARYDAGLLDAEEKRFFQWNIFYRKFNILKSNKEPNYKLFNNLRYDSRKNIFEQFILRLRLFADALPENGRLIIVIDPEQDTPSVRVELWSQIVRELPSKVFFLFAQRFNDALAINEEFCSLNNVHFLPPSSSPQGLSDLSDADTLQLVNHYEPLLKKHLTGYQLPFPVLCNELREIFHHYRNHPYAIHAVINLLFCQNITEPSRLPRESMANRVAAAQWRQIVEHPQGKNAVLLFEAYTVLTVPSLDEMVCWVADISLESFRQILADPFLQSLIRVEPDGRLIYHHYLSAYIRSLLYAPNGSLTAEAEWLHQRAMVGYGELMRSSLKPDALATVRLPEHALVVGGANLFAETLGHCADALLSLGFFQTFGSMLERALSLVTPETVEESDLLFLFGQLRYRQEDWQSAVEYYERSLRIARKITEPERIANALLALGKVARQQQRHAKTEQYLREAIVYYESGTDFSDLVESLLLLGEVLWIQRKVEESEIAFEEAAKVAAKIRNYRQRVRALAAVFTIRGRILDELGDTTLASELYHKALDLTQSIYDRETEAEIHSKLSSLFERSGNLRKSEENLVQAMKIHREMTLVEQWAEDNLHLARLAQKQGNGKLVQDCLQQARQLYRQLGNNLKINEINDET